MKTKEHQKQPADPKSLWQKTQYANLIRYVPSGTYFARFRVKGKLVWRSLKTDRVTIAHTRLPDEIEKERKKAENASALVKGKMTGGDAIRIYNERIQGRVDLKPLTKAYHTQRIDGLLRSWSALEKADLSKVTKTDCLNWAARFGPEVSATTFNHTVGILRALFEIGIEAGIRFDNPAKAVNRVTERLKKLQLPEPDQFQNFIQEIENSGSGFSRPCANLVRFLKGVHALSVPVRDDAQATPVHNPNPWSVPGQSAASFSPRTQSIHRRSMSTNSQRSMHGLG